MPDRGYVPVEALEQAREVAMQLLAACPFRNLPLPELWRWRDDPAYSWLWGPCRNGGSSDDV